MSGGLPSRRRKIVGETYEGERLELELSIAKKLYRCPACRGYIGIGQEHVFVRYPDADAAWDHEHWHRECAETKLLRALSVSHEAATPRPPRGRRRGRR
jgi:hypothetical protein